MVEKDRETVVVEGNRRSSFGWLIGLIVFIVLVLLFFMFGGFDLFTGMGGGTETINVDTPDTINVQGGAQ